MHLRPPYRAAETPLNFLSFRAVRSRAQGGEGVSRNLLLEVALGCPIQARFWLEWGCARGNSRA
jgi:hypothetical protein